MGRGRERSKTTISLLQEYLGAVTLIALATWSRVLMDDAFGDRLLFLIYMPLLVAMAWFYRQGPVLLATLLSLLASQRFFIEPHGGLRFTDPIELVQIALYLFVVLATLVVARALKGAKGAAEKSADEARRSAEALRRNEEQYRASFELASVGNSQSDPISGRFIRVNAKLCEITGYTRQELLQRTFYDLTHPADRDVTRRAMAQLVGGSVPAYVLEKRYVRKDGEVVWVRVSATLVRDAKGNPDRSLAVVEDITERKQAQESLAQYRDHLEDIVRQRTDELQASHERLRRTERLASLGTLAAGLGHDLGNLLMPLGMRLDVLRSMPVPPAARAELQAIETCVEYLGALARGLRQCTLDPEEHDEPDASTDLSAWVSDTAPLLRLVLGKAVTLELDVPERLPAIAMAPHRLTQCAVNLVQNARDAVEPTDSPREGVVRLSARRDEAGETVGISIHDKGRGMTEEVRARCLEPFYTTRVRGLSTGLGLSLVNGTVRACGGRLQIESVLGEGTTVTMHLPVPEAAEAPQQAPQQPGAVVTISDARIATLVGSVLSASGYAVRHGDPEETDDVGLWVTDGVPNGIQDPLNRARQYLKQGGPRRVVVVGAGAGPEWTDVGAVVVRSGVTPSAIREAVGA